MKRRLYITGEAKNFDFFFDQEKDKWIVVYDIRFAEYVVDVCHENIERQFQKLGSLNDDQILILITNVEINLNPNLDNYSYLARCIEKHKKTLFMHNNLMADIEGIRDYHFLASDIFFNRQKLYFTYINKSNWINFKSRWTICEIKDAYQLDDLAKKDMDQNKLFLCLNRLPPISDNGLSLDIHYEYKKKLKNFIDSSKNILSRTYIGNPNAGAALLYNGCTITENIDKHFTSGIFYPAASKYYQTSYISIYIESNHNMHHNFNPCEKTFNPLIQGNFILPYARPNFIKLLTEFYGFQLPKWIDYSYDRIVDDDERLEAYFKSIQLVASMSQKNIHRLYLRDKHMLEHNRNIFYQRPYNDTLGKIDNAIKHLGW